MGKEIVYCTGCGTILRERDFTLSLAHTVDFRPFCIQCRPLATPTLPVNAVRTPTRNRRSRLRPPA